MDLRIVKSFILVSFLMIGCGPQSQFERAKKLEDEGQFHKAWNKYQEFVAKHPKHELAAEALFRAGWVTEKGLGDCYMANTFYESVTVRYPQSDPWADAAALAPMSCPDYFPLIPQGRWVEGDSDSKGKIARTVIRARPLSYTTESFPSQMAKLERVFYAGKEKFRTTRFVYKKEKNELLEFVSEKDPRAKTILKWPLEVGTKWRTKLGGRFFNYEIVSVNEEVRVKAGAFSKCLKVKSSVSEGSGARYEYYAPGVGRILTTLSTKKGEKRNTELLSYEIPDIFEFQSPKKPS